jgi:hypothetical protein
MIENRFCEWESESEDECIDYDLESLLSEWAVKF